jgi:thiamine monophosphate synthase
LREIREKEKQGVNYLFISPIFKKDEKKSLGLYRFINISKYTKCKIVALGGINGLNIKKLKLIKVNKFASIKYIKSLYGK